MSVVFSAKQFLGLFIVLSLVSGITIGMNKIFITMLGINLHLTPWQMGLISGAESFAMALATLPAGAFIAAYSPRFFYVIVSVLLTAIYLMLSFVKPWAVIACLMALGGFCIAFRIVAMSSSFLTRLSEIGAHRAGWYKGSLFLGVMVFGPLMGNFIIATLGSSWAFYVSAVFFSLLAVLGYFILPSQPSVKREAAVKPEPFMVWIKALLLCKPVREACLYEGLGSCIAAFFGAFILVIVMREHSWSSQSAICLLIVYGVAYVSVLLGAGKVIAKLDDNHVYRFAHGIVVMGLVLLCISDYSWQFFLGALLNGVGLGFNNLINMTRIAKSSVNKSHVSGLLTLGQMAGGTLGAVVGGSLGGIMGLQWIFLLLAVPWLVRIAREIKSSGNS